MMLGRKREAERTRLLAKRFEMPPALSTTNLRCSPRQLRKQGARWGGRRVGTVTQQQERPDRQMDGRTSLPHAEFSLAVLPGWGERARGGTAASPGTPIPTGGCGGRLRGVGAGVARLNCTHWALPWLAMGRTARLTRRRGFAG